SVDDNPAYEHKLQWICNTIERGEAALWEALRDWPSIRFGVEQAFMSLQSDDPFLLFPSEFTSGAAPILINGLIWMGDEMFMKRQIEEKLNAGFSCIKMKIGAIDFNTELKLLASIRRDFSPQEIEIRVDANGAFHPAEAQEKLKRLSDLSLHSIEQPIAVRQWEAMAELCETSPLPVALDEELIGIFDTEEKENMLHAIKPHYIILKPSLIGGFKCAGEWIRLAGKNHINWWVTSALESTIGLNAIAQWTFGLKNLMPQGLGTGSLFVNNFTSPLTVKNGRLHYLCNGEWIFNLFD
ncbi:MAG: o-succinylbenzoate synthase, partial [Sinomicrobium sp.]|nr:o-succinylbenzoate synthase [Sinomicrobium sp.]